MKALGWVLVVLGAGTYATYASAHHSPVSDRSAIAGVTVLAICVGIVATGVWLIRRKQTPNGISGRGRANRL